MVCILDRSLALFLVLCMSFCLALLMNLCMPGSQNTGTQKSLTNSIN